MGYMLRLLAPCFQNLELIEASENDITHTSRFRASGLQAIAPSHDGAPVLLQESDSITVSAQFENSDPEVYSSIGVNPNWTEFITALSNDASFHPEGSLSIEVRIQKTQNTDELSLYDLSVFSETIFNLTLSQSLSVFNRVLSKSGFRCFRVVDLNAAFATSSMRYLPNGVLREINPPKDRSKRIDSVSGVSYFQKDDECRLLPSDFQVIEGLCPDQKLVQAFSSLELLLSLAQIVDISSLKDDMFAFKLNGLRTTKGNIDVKSAPPRHQGQYARIHEWIYSGGVTIDKIGLARNIISLHLERPDGLDLKGRPYDAILSGYKIYEKQNIKTYIELRNKVSEQLIDFNNRASKVVQDFASGFQRSALALLSFYTTAIVVKVVSKDLSHLFNTDITLLSIAFLAASMMYYCVCKWEVRQQRVRFISSYEQMKERQSDILDDEDVRRILNDDKEHNLNVKYIDEKIRVYQNLWLGLVTLLFCATLALYVVFMIDVLVGHPIIRFIIGNP
ncbi:MAG: hypothetical protein QM724_09425 [Flavobacteriales bacterium]